MSPSEKEISEQKKIPVSADVRIWRQQTIQKVLRAMAIFGFFMAAAGSYSAYTYNAEWAVSVYVGSYIAVVILALWKQAPYVLQVGAIQVLLYTITFVVFITRGLGDSSRIYLLTMVFISGLFGTRRTKFLTLGLALATMIGMGWAFTGGYITNFEEIVSTDLISWVALSTEMLGMSVVITVLLNSFLLRSNAFSNKSKKLTQELQTQQAALEQQVKVRTISLERRSAQLEAATFVASEIAEFQDIEILLEETVNLISNRFGFYHTGIFILEESGEYAVLRAASSEGGKRMLARNHRLKVEQTSIVGYVTEKGTPRIVLDVGEDAVYFDNPNLPETRSELALPLRARGNTIGALDVQSLKPKAFTEEDVTILQTLADQLAVAIDNTRLLAEAQSSLKAAQRAYGEVSREAWEKLLSSQSQLRKRYDPEGILPDQDQWSQETQQALQQGNTVISQNQRLTVPIKARGQTIGAINIQKSKDTTQWTKEETTLVETLTEQLGIALESARLYQDTQQRAAREQLTGKITSRMRETLDMDAIMKTAADEIRQALELPEVVVQLIPPQTISSNEEKDA